MIEPTRSRRCIACNPKHPAWSFVTLCAPHALALAELESRASVRMTARATRHRRDRELAELGYRDLGGEGGP